MKILFNKLKKCNRPLLIIFIVSLIIYLISFGLFTISLLRLADIETIFRIACIILFFLYFGGFLIGGLISLITKRKKT